jgi:eukaryotic-like serine/threonine-protein kinase
LHPGDLISGKYRLLRLLGSGGMGSVWAARNELTARDFAIKFLLPDLVEDKASLNRFFLEARACGQIKHPAVVDVYDMGQADDGSPYLVMELLEGEGFDERLKRVGVFRPAEAAAWIAFIARGLEEAHIRGLIHRDIKPGNIFFALDDRGDVIPKVLDFGVSKAIDAGSPEDLVKTATGAVLGSPSYMSPEQASGEPDIDGRSDVWSLGVLLYEALSGHLPFEGLNYNALMVAIISKPHRALRDRSTAIPEELSLVVDAALAKDRATRISSARELAERLEAVADHLGGGPDLPRLRPRILSLMPGPASLHGHEPTQDTFVGGKRRLFSRLRSKTLLRAAAVVLAMVAGGALALFMQPPAVALSGRVAVLLTTQVESLQRELARLTSEQRAEEERVAAGGSTSTSASSGGAAHPSAAPVEGATGSTGRRPPRPAGSGAWNSGKTVPDPHGGVDSAGF